VRDASWPEGAYAAEWASAAELSVAVRVLSEKGYSLIETYSPVPIVHRMHRSRSRLPVVVFIAGLLGGIASYAIQWYANAYAYPLNIGGRPSHAIPAFLIPTFEGTVLCASLAAFVGFFVIARLPQPWHPVFEIDGFERATADRYWLAIDASDRRSRPDVTVHELGELSPLRIVRLDAHHA
jgi:hypothetical protein